MHIWYVLLLLHNLVRKILLILIQGGFVEKDDQDTMTTATCIMGQGTKEQIGALEANLFHCRGCKNEVISLVLLTHVHCCYCFSRGRLVSQCIPSNEEEENDFHCVWDHHLWQ